MGSEDFAFRSNWIGVLTLSWTFIDMTYSDRVKMLRRVQVLVVAVLLVVACSPSGGGTQATPTATTGLTGGATTIAELPTVASTAVEPVSTPRATTAFPDDVLIVEVDPGSGVGEEAEVVAEQWIGEFESGSADMVGSVDTPAGRYDLVRYRSVDGSGCVIAILGDVGSGVCETADIEITQTLLDPFAEGLLIAPGEVTKVTARTVDGHEIVGFPRRGTIVMAWPVEWGEALTLTAETPAGTVQVLPARR